VGKAHIYDDPEQALIVEPKYIIERNQKAVKRVNCAVLINV